jgi:hypothetical protein
VPASSKLLEIMLFLPNRRSNPAAPPHRAPAGTSPGNKKC